jgi:hypothetical protein
MIKVRFFNQDDYHRKEGLLDFNAAQSGYFLHWGIYNSNTVAYVRNIDGNVYMVFPEWIKFEEDPVGILVSRLTDLFHKIASDEKLEEMKAIINKYIS